MFTLQLENLTNQRRQSPYGQTSDLSQTKEYSTPRKDGSQTKEYSTPRKGGSQTKEYSTPRKYGSQTKDYSTPRKDGSQTKDYSTPKKDCSTPPRQLSTKKKDVYDLDFTESRFYLIQYYYIGSKFSKKFTKKCFWGRMSNFPQNLAKNEFLVGVSWDLLLKLFLVVTVILYSILVIVLARFHWGIFSTRRKLKLRQVFI